MSKSLIENILLKLEAENPKDHSGFQHGIEAASEIVNQAGKDAEFQNTELRLECLKLAAIINQGTGCGSEVVVFDAAQFYNSLTKPTNQ